MKKEKLFKHVSEGILNPLALLQVVSCLVFVSSIFVCIWGSWDLAWRLGLTGFILSLIFGRIYKFVEKIMRDVVDQELEKRKDELYKGSMFQPKTKSKFEDRVEKALEKAREAKLNNKN
jgi:uncharacterized membrane protein